MGRLFETKHDIYMENRYKNFFSDFVKNVRVTDELNTDELNRRVLHIFLMQAENVGISSLTSQDKQIYRK